jgi:hypothetical protein
MSSTRTANAGALSTVDEVGSDGARDQERPQRPDNLYDQGDRSFVKNSLHKQARTYGGGPLSQSKEGHRFLFKYLYSG